MERFVDSLKQFKFKDHFFDNFLFEPSKTTFLLILFNMHTTHLCWEDDKRANARKKNGLKLMYAERVIYSKWIYMSDMFLSEFTQSDMF